MFRRRLAPWGRLVTARPPKRCRRPGQRRRRRISWRWPRDCSGAPINRGRIEVPWRFTKHCARAASPRCVQAQRPTRSCVRATSNLALLQDSLRNQDEAVFSGALKATAGLPGTAVTRALEQSLSQAPKARLAAIIQALGARQDPEALTTLSNLARDQFSPLRIPAIEAIAQIGSPRSVPVLVQIQGAPDAASAQAAKAALAAIPGPEADKAVYDMLSGANTQTRITGLELVARRRMTSAMPQLLKLSKEGDPRSESRRHPPNRRNGRSGRNPGFVGCPADLHRGGADRCG